tara:strand:- start:106 stop:330 length:225 start_codon:yes stop_codon:yes gene_type:complete
MKNKNNKRRGVETSTRNPNLFSVMLERNPVTGVFSVVGHQAKRLVMKNQYAGEWVKVAPRDMARALRKNPVVAS